jgi:MFS family permease
MSAPPRDAGGASAAPAPPSPPDAASRTSWSTVAVVVGVAIAAAMQIGKVPPALPAIRADLGLDLVTAGWVLSVFYLVGLALGMVAGAIARRLGERRAVAGGLMVLAAASAVGALAPGAGLLLAARFVEGSAFLVVIVAGPSLLMRAARPADVRLAFGFWGTYMPSGTAFMMLVSPLLLEPFGWRALWLANGALMALAALVAWQGTRGLATGPAAGRSGEGVARDIRAVLAASGPLRLACTFGAYTAMYLSVLGFLPTLLIEGAGVAPARAAVAGALAVAVNILGNLAGGFLMHRGVRRSTLMVVGAFAMAASAWLVYRDGVALEWRYVACLVFSGVGGLLPPAALSGAPVFAPGLSRVPLVNGLIVQGSNLGQALGPPTLAALVAFSGGWQIAPWLLAVPGLLAIGLALGLRPLERAAQP